MHNLFQDKRILLGVTGSIACYKAADLASKLAQAGALVDVILTESAQEFVTPLTFQSVTGRRAYVDADLWGSEGHVQHIGLGHQADLMVIAPATANTIARLAHGIADNLLTVTALAIHCPLLVAPAMDGGMYSHPATQANLEILAQRGVILIGPAEGHLASGLAGKGRLVETAELLGQIRLALAQDGPLSGRKILVTAGGTQEPIDAVRVIANRSSGKQGFALAQAALDLGAQVTLISGPVSLPTPVGAQRIDVSTAEEMLQAMLPSLPRTDALLMAAAVADFRPAQAASHKLKKEDGLPEIRLEKTPDILRAVNQIKAEHYYPEIVVGFAAESQDLLDNARSKLEAKHLDLIAANDITALDAGFGVDTNRVILLDACGGQEILPLMDKTEVAEIILERVVRLMLEREIVHICPRKDWETAQAGGEYRAGSLESEGFIHCSRPGQVLRVANTYFTGSSDLVMLWIQPESLRAPLHWDAVGAETYPHIYGPINLDAVTAVGPLEADADGDFRKLPIPQKEQPRFPKRMDG